jgi:hypothetical protein
MKFGRLSIAFGCGNYCVNHLFSKIRFGLSVIDTPADHEGMPLCVFNHLKRIEADTHPPSMLTVATPLAKQIAPFGKRTDEQRWTKINQKPVAKPLTKLRKHFLRSLRLLSATSRAIEPPSKMS